MKLKELLKESGYDFIDGLVRHHKPLQLWQDTLFTEPELWYENLSEALQNDIVLSGVESDALAVDFSQKNEYAFNVGATALDSVLKSLGLGSVQLSSKFSFGKKLTIGFEEPTVIEYPHGNLNDYLSTSDFTHYNPNLLKQANKDNLILITGVIYAKNLVVEIHTNQTIDTTVEASISEIVEGKLTVTLIGEKQLRLTATKGVSFPVAVKAHRLDFDGGRFIRIKPAIVDKF